MQLSPALSRGQFWHKRTDTVTAEQKLSSHFFLKGFFSLWIPTTFYPKSSLSAGQCDYDKSDLTTGIK